MTIDHLREVVGNGRGVLVVGAGASVSATAGAPESSWLGLIRNAVSFVEQYSDPTVSWVARVSGALDEMEVAPDASELLQLASQVIAKIKAIGAQAFSNWLEGAVGALTVKNYDWPNAIVDLGLPILTTNYDHLLEQASSRSAVDWHDPRALQRTVVDGTYIGHLHGHYDNPDAVVLSEADYALQQSSNGLRSIEQAISSTKSIIYIGCGGTLEDPNFSALLEWHKNVFPVSGVEHYRLCLERELGDLMREHADSNITPISYGRDYEDLPAFLESISASSVNRRPGEIVRDIGRDCREYLLDQLRQESIVGGRLRDVENASLEAIVIPPVLLPLPHDEYLRARQDAPESVQRLDPLDELDTDVPMLIVADEAAGLSTALRWMLVNASAGRGLTPLSLDFRALPNKPDPFGRALRREARNRAVVNDIHAPLPSVVVGIDNFHGRGRTAERMAAELIGRDGLTIIGCSKLQETEAIAVLRAAGLRFRIRYLGKLGTEEVRAMVAIASQAEADTLTQLVTQVLSAEHLPRTPFTVALLVEVMLQGEKVLSNASPTAILDQYVQHLLGRDDASQDSRLVISAADRESILVDLANGFVMGDQGSLKQSDCIARLERFFARYAWDESPATVLADLTRRRVLSVDGSQVRFTQSSFLHLFAAKAAARNGETRDLLLSRPLYYASVLRAYAALSRNDQDALESLAKLLEHVPTASQSSYEEAEPLDASDSMAERIIEVGEETRSSGVASSVNKVPDHFDATTDTDILPFPVADDAEMSKTDQFVQGLALVSVFLRDSEEVDDLALKRSVLKTVLGAWGHVADLLSEEEAFQQYSRQMLEQLAARMDAQEEYRTFLDAFMRLFPHLFVYANIASSLASRKLLVIARELSLVPEIKEDVRAAVPLAIFLEATKGDKWEQELSALIEPFMRVPIVSDLMLGLLVVNYNYSLPGSGLEARVRNLAADIYVSRYKFKGAAHRAAVRAAYLQHMKADKDQFIREGGLTAAARGALSIDRP
ncbi:hypothetical protein DOT97_00555 [Clavibacter michiganensis subsp. michiganensis]|uniref:SIR2 family NAD-dependent protein deacylase n=1 Tax=Clavibacter michiganensis TaxID=28447 RepID=UPI001365D134|nr:SIR2 family protein [Clavibacter michiganensis]MWJ23697.1 hypothetical protein [Clavibacter michiganensis subsp. michiganensis]